MLGHKWVPAEGTVISSAREQMELPGQHGMHWVEVYELDVRTPDGQTGQARVPGPGLGGLHPGTVVRLETNAKTGEIRMHPDWHTAVIRNGPVPPAGPSGAGPAINVSGPGSAGIAQVLGNALPAGSHVMIGGTDAADILRTVLSGDPAQRAAAKEQLRELAQSQGQGPVIAFGNVSVTGSGPGFGPGPGSGAAAGSSGDFGDAPAPFTSPQAPSASPSDRLAALEQLLERGQVSHAEFDTMRQQILGSL
jgi:hypothetical protein